MICGLFGRDKNSSVVVVSFWGVGSLGSKGGWYSGIASFGLLQTSP